jgi:hypothetical protein
VKVIEMRSLDFSALRIERLHVAVAEVVGENVEDVGLGGRLGGGERKRQQQEDGGEGEDEAVH